MASVLQDRGRAAAIHHLELMGWEILDGDFESFIVAVDEEGCIVFAYPRTKRGAMPTDVHHLREKFERAAADYLAENGMGIATVRCDVLKMQVASENRALLRHEVNVLDAI